MLRAILVASLFCFSTSFADGIPHDPAEEDDCNKKVYLPSAPQPPPAKSKASSGKKHDKKGGKHKSVVAIHKGDPEHKDDGKEPIKPVYVPPHITNTNINTVNVPPAPAPTPAPTPAPAAPPPLKYETVVRAPLMTLLRQVFKPGLRLGGFVLAVPGRSWKELYSGALVAPRIQAYWSESSAVFFEPAVLVHGGQEHTGTMLSAGTVFGLGQNLVLETGLAWTAASLDWHDFVTSGAPTVRAHFVQADLGLSGKWSVGETTSFLIGGQFLGGIQTSPQGLAFSPGLVLKAGFDF